MKLLCGLLLFFFAGVMGLLAVCLSLLKLDRLTGALADFNTFIFSGACLGVAVLLALAAWWLTEERR